MGDNGHTASLFPGLTAVREKDALVLAVVGTVMTVFQ
jgi:6-phosphogluconolactonase/glucosamine-6-phosphate isomerase/deaminase